MPATAQVRIAADASQFTKTMQKVNSTFDKTSKKIGALSAFKNIFQGLSKGLGAVGSIGGLTAAVNSYKKFEKDVAEVYTLMPNANKAFFDKMEKDVLDFSERFGMNTENVTKGMYQAISAGIKPEGITDDGGFLDIAAKAAVAGVTDLKTAVDSLTNVVNSYGAGVYDMQQVSDMMFRAVSMSKTTFREMSDYLYQVLPTAGSLKLRLDDLLGSISALAAQGTLTRVATTQIRQMLIEIGRAGDKANLAFLEASQGIPVQSFIRNGGRMTDIIDMMGKVARKRGTDIRNLFGSVEAGNAAISLYNSLSFKNMVGELDEESNATAGETNKAFQKIFNTISVQWDILTTKLFNVFKRLGRVIKPVIVDIVKFFNTQFDEGMDALNLDDFVKTFAEAYSAIKKRIQSEGLGAVIRDSLEGVFAYLTLSFIELSKSIADFFIDLVSGASGSSNAVVQVFSTLGQALVNIWTKVSDYISEKIESAMLSVLTTMIKAKNAVSDFFSGDSKEDKELAFKKTAYIESKGGDEDKAFSDAMERNQVMGMEEEVLNRGSVANRSLIGKLLEPGALNTSEMQKEIESSFMKLTGADQESINKGKEEGKFPEVAQAFKEYKSGSAEGREKLSDLMTMVETLRVGYQDTGVDMSEDFRNLYTHLQRAKSNIMAFAAESEGLDFEDINTKRAEHQAEEFIKTAKKKLEDGGIVIGKGVSLVMNEARTAINAIQKSLKEKVDEQIAKLKDKDFVVEEPESGQQDLSTGEKPEEFQYFNKFGKVVADSMQRIGGGGNTSNFISPLDKNTSAVSKLTEAIQKEIAETSNFLDDFGKNVRQSYMTPVGMREGKAVMKTVDDSPSMDFSYDTEEFFSKTFQDDLKFKWDKTMEDVQGIIEKSNIDNSEMSKNLINTMPTLDMSPYEKNLDKGRNVIQNTDTVKSPDLEKLNFMKFNKVAEPNVEKINFEKFNKVADKLLVGATKMNELSENDDANTTYPINF